MKSYKFQAKKKEINFILKILSLNSIIMIQPSFSCFCYTCRREMKEREIKMTQFRDEKNRNSRCTLINTYMGQYHLPFGDVVIPTHG